MFGRLTIGGSWVGVAMRNGTAERMQKRSCPPGERWRFEEVEEVGRGEGQGYFALEAGGCGFDSHPVHLGDGSLRVERHNVPGQRFPSSSFLKERRLEK
jgi:hypothetical protein